jgi:hypothetical protein
MKIVVIYTRATSRSRCGCPTQRAFRCVGFLPPITRSSPCLRVSVVGVSFISGCPYNAPFVVWGFTPPITRSSPCLRASVSPWWCFLQFLIDKVSAPVLGFQNHPITRSRNHPFFSVPLCLCGRCSALSRFGRTSTSKTPLPRPAQTRVNPPPHHKSHLPR